MTSRLFVPELMDDLAGSEDELIRTLRDFRILNRLFSRTGTLVKRYLIPHMRMQGAREIVVADLGAGGCDFALWLTGLCRRERLSVRVLCIDSDARAVAFGRRVCRGRGNIEVRLGSAYSIDTNNEPIDYIVANHFLHHVETPNIPLLLKKIHGTARCGFLINDLARSAPAYFGFSLFCLAFLRRGLASGDGKLSIRKGFLSEEMSAFASKASLPEPFIVGSLHPGRVFLYSVKDRFVSPS